MTRFFRFLIAFGTQFFGHAIATVGGLFALGAFFVGPWWCVVVGVLTLLVGVIFIAFGEGLET